MECKEFVQRLRLMPQSDLVSIMKDCGFTKRQIDASIRYIYERPDINAQADALGESVPTFYRKRRVLACRLKLFMEGHGIDLPSGW